MTKLFRDTPIAIVGMACRVPGANSLDAFWQLLVDGRCMIGEAPADRLNKELYFDPLANVPYKTYTATGGIMEYTPFDASRCPLPLRILPHAEIGHQTICQVAADACRHAGLNPFDLPIRNAGVWVGHNLGGPVAGDVIYGVQVAKIAEHLRTIEAFSRVAGADADAIIRQIIHDTRAELPQRRSGGAPESATRLGAMIIAESLGLDGPAMILDAACSSALQGLVMASRALQLGRIEMAVVGGASYLHVDSLMLFSKAQAASRRYQSCPFDAEADGLVSGEGYAAIIIKTLDRALADNDPIQAVISGIGVSSDGRGKSLWAPRKEGQALAMRRAYEQGLDIGRLQYVEAHATSTRVGDMTELKALTEVLAEHMPPGVKIPIGGVKANIGHTLESAGLAGLIKTVLAMQRELIPRQINVRNLNPGIDWSTAPFYVPQENTPWPAFADGHPRRAAVNSFGIGGLNVHVVLDQHVGPPAERVTPRPGTRSTARPGRNGALSAAPMPLSPRFAATLSTAASPSASNSTAALPVASPARSSAQEPIAIIGRGCVFPGARTAEAFWQLLASGQDAKSDVPPDRWNVELAYDPTKPTPWRSVARRGGFVVDFKCDWRRHRMPPNQIEKCDPLQLMILDATDAALAEAGYDKGAYDKTRTGVVVGTVFGSDFFEDLQMGFRLTDFRESISKALRSRSIPADQIREVGDAFVETLLQRVVAITDETGGFTPSTLASRLTKMLDLMGGAVTLDAGNASALAAVYSASDMLLDGSCDMVICAAGHRAMGLSTFEFMSLAGMLAADDSHAPFDAAARGHLPGEGVGVVVLKRLSDAQRDGNTIRGVIRSVGASFSMDTETSVVRAIERAQRSAGAPFQELLLETSGTGLADDAAELRGVARALGQRTATDTVGANGDVHGVRSAQLVVSSLVGQLGHSQGASGMASLLAATHAFEAGAAPARYGMRSPHEELARPNSPLRLADSPTPLVTLDGSAPVVGVNSLDAFGAAYHLVLERGVKIPSVEAHVARSGASETAWRTIRLEASTFDELRQKLADSDARTLFASAPADRFSPAPSCRLAVVASSVDDLAKKLKLAASSFDPANPTMLARKDIFLGQAASNGKQAKIALLFSGQGSQAAGMMRSLVDECPAAARALEAMEQTLRGLGMPTFADVAWDRPEELGKDVWRTQLSLLCADLIAFASLDSLGIRPHFLAGHSFGEYPALCAAGAWDFATAARGALARARAIESSTRATGGMISVMAGEETAERICREVGGDVYSANYNAPDQTVVGGAPAALDRLEALLKAEKIAYRRLAVPRPFHTPLMQETQSALADGLAPLSILAPRLPLWSSVTNAPVESAAAARANLIAQMTVPVRYVDLISRLADRGARVFLETGPQQVLTGLHQKILVDRGCVSLACDDKTKGGLSRLLAIEACLDVFAPRNIADRIASPSAASARRPTSGAATSVPPQGAGMLKPKPRLPQSAAKSAYSNGFKPHEPSVPSSPPTAVTPKGRANAAPTKNGPVKGGAESTGATPPSPHKQAATANALTAQSPAEASPYESGAAFGRGNVAELRQLARRYADAADMPASDPSLLATAEFERRARESVARLSADEREALRGMADAAGVSAEVLSLYHGWTSAQLGERAASMSPKAASQSDSINAIAERSLVGGPWGETAFQLSLGMVGRHARPTGSQPTAVASPPRATPAVNRAALQPSAISRMPLTEYLSGVQSVNGRPPFDVGDRVCQRFVLRTLRTRTPVVAPAAQRLAGNALIVGRNPVGLALRREIEALGRRAVIVPLSADIDRTLESVDKLWQAYQPLHLFLVTPFDADAQPKLEFAAWQRRRQRGVTLPYLVCQRWFTRLSEQKLVEQASVVAATALGGDLGLSGVDASPESGALCGLLKGLCIEIGMATKWAFKTLVVDYPRDSEGEHVAHSLLHTLWSRPPFMEMGYRNSERRVNGVIHRPARPAVGIAPTRGKPWLLTGGARGITGAVAQELGRRFGVKLHLVGTSPREPLGKEALDESPAVQERLRGEITQRAIAAQQLPAEAWNRFRKSVEIETTLRDLERAGVSAAYHVCDVSDRGALQKLIDEIRRADGSLEGIVHGAGVEIAARFVKKERRSIERTIASKVDGAANLIELTRDDSLRFFVGFGSISGRWGSVGQTDYCLASEMLAKLIDWLRVERPTCHATCFHWQPWADVGMAVRNETRGSRTLQNLHLLPVAEGVRHFIDELLAGCPEPEVVITDWDYYKRYCPDLSAAQAAEVFLPDEPAEQPRTAPQASLGAGRPAENSDAGETPAHGENIAIDGPPWALLDRVVELRAGERIVAEAHFDPTADPFLREHRLRDVPTMPLVIAIESFVEAAAAVIPRSPGRVICREVEISDAVRFFTSAPITARVTAEADSGGVRCRLNTDFYSRAGKLVQADRRHFSALVATAESSDAPTPSPIDPPPAESWFAINYVQADALLYHGPPLQLLKRVAVRAEDALGQIEFPQHDDLAGRRAGRRWRTPSAGLDACLYACGVYTWFHSDGGMTVPAGLAEVIFVRSPHPGELATVHVIRRDLQAKHAEFDFVLFGAAGDVIFQARGYRAHVLRGGAGR